MAHLSTGIGAEFSHRPISRQLVNWPVEWISLGPVFTSACSDTILASFAGVVGQGFPSEGGCDHCGQQTNLSRKMQRLFKGIEGIRTNLWWEMSFEVS